MANKSEVLMSRIVCQRKYEVRSKGVFFGDNPLKFATPVLFAQLSLSALCTNIFHLFLHPLGESTFVSQMLSCVVTGPTLWGENNPVLNALYPVRSIHINKVFAIFGTALFVFLVGVKTDISLVKRAGKKAMAIGLLSFVVPICLNTIVAAIIKTNFQLSPDLDDSIYFIASFLAVNSFHVVFCLLADLNLLNSELGRLATSASLVSGLLSWCWAVITFTLVNKSVLNRGTELWMFLSLGGLVMIIVCIFRPRMLAIVRSTSEGKAVREGHIMLVFMLVLICLLISEIIGYHMIIGPMILGMATPEGPPLGSALVNKLESFIASLLLPAYFTLIGYRMNILKIRSESMVVIQFMMSCNFVGKLFAAVVPSLYCKMPPVDALCLGLIMSTQGITDVLLLGQAMGLKLINQEEYTIISLSFVMVTAITTPIVKYLYKPSQRYISHKKRTIEHADPEAELRIMTGIYCQYQTPAIIKLLELSNPTPKSPICFYVIHLLELIGRSTPLLIAHRPDAKSSTQAQGSQHIINAFRSYEDSNENSVVVNIYTAVSPYATMHDEVCSLALEKRVSLVILPFHKQWSKETQLEELHKSVRSVNQQILLNAPCSVGILVDRGTLTSTSKMSYNIGMIFVEGPDDREALAYVMRMGECLNVHITVTRLIDSNRKRKENHKDEELDELIINDFKIANVGKKYHAYKEEFACDSVEMVKAIRAIGKCYDLIMVGRRHDNDSPLFMGLTEWNEFPELGFLGDMLSSSDYGYNVSVLVMQQQKFSKSKNMLEDSCLVLDISHY